MLSEVVVVASAMSVGDTSVSRANQVADHSMMRTSPMERLSDASQRTVPCASRLGAALVGGDASQRKPIGAVSVDVTIVSADASQGSPHTFGQITSMQEQALLGSPTGITGTCPVAANPGSVHSSAMPDASQRSPKPITEICPVVVHAMPDASRRSTDAGVATQMIADPNCNVLKSWLSGTSMYDSSVSDSELAELLRAAAPESYED